jgi:hypothetical protein
MGTSSKFQTRVIEGILFLESNASAAGIGLMMNGNITNQTCNAYSPSKQSEYSLFIFANVQNTFSLQK